MLLTEVVATRTEIEPGKFQYTPDIEKSRNDKKTQTGLQMIPINFQKEEKDFFVKRGITSLPSIPVAYAWSIEKPSLKKSNPDDYNFLTGLMHALKDRDEDHVMSQHDLNNIYKSGIERLSKTPPKLLSYHSDDDKKAYGQIQKMLTTLTHDKYTEVRNDYVIVPLSSSSSVIKMITQAVHDVSKIQVVWGAFKKNHWPRLSEYYRTVTGGEKYHKRDTSREQSPHNKHRILLTRQRKIKQLISQLENADFNTDSELKNIESQIDALQQEDKQIQQTLKDTKFRISTAQTAVDKNRGFYNYQLATSNAQQLAGKHVILIDDNVVKGYTMADAVKSLYRNNIIPKSVCGIVPHRYKSFNNEDD
ncbi:MAG: hypothetical protein CTY12_01515 [Methylotenera sp.]|nr:MAG: hypothetical protein CTY12_01515 [Methylotenera sp.]